jgi:cbb3-type cytochrome oxidase subunit 3
MSHSGLSGYAVIAMILFILVFVAIVVRIFRPSRRDELEHKRNIPFDDDETPGAPGSGDTK